MVGVDCGGGRSWSAAVGIWPSGRCEALALTAGVPDIAAQETRDRVPRGTYQILADAGLLVVAIDRRVPPLDLLADRIREWQPVVVTCDRFRINDLRDAIGGRVPIVGRAMLPSECDADVRALRRLTLDGPLSVAPGSRALLQASLAVSEVEHDKSGNCRLIKTGARHDCAPRRCSRRTGTSSRYPRTTPPPGYCPTSPCRLIPCISLVPWATPTVRLRPVG